MSPFDLKVVDVVRACGGGIAVKDPSLSFIVHWQGVGGAFGWSGLTKQTDCYSYNGYSTFFCFLGGLLVTRVFTRE